MRNLSSDLVSSVEEAVLINEVVFALNTPETKVHDILVEHLVKE